MNVIPRKKEAAEVCGGDTEHSCIRSSDKSLSKMFLLSAPLILGGYLEINQLCPSD